MFVPQHLTLPPAKSAHAKLSPALTDVAGVSDATRTGVERADAVLVPAALVAVTLNWYESPLVKFGTEHESWLTVVTTLVQTCPCVSDAV